jgi:hypothetical protein
VATTVENIAPSPMNAPASTPSTKVSATFRRALASPPVSAFCAISAGV